MVIYAPGVWASNTFRLVMIKYLLLDPPSGLCSCLSLSVLSHFGRHIPLPLSHYPPHLSLSEATFLSVTSGGNCAAPLPTKAHWAVLQMFMSSCLSLCIPQVSLSFCRPNPHSAYSFTSQTLRLGLSLAHTSTSGGKPVC